MQFQVKNDNKSIDLIGQSYRLHFPLSDSATEGLEVYNKEGNSELLIGRVRYFGKVIEKQDPPAPKSPVDAIGGKSTDMTALKAKVVSVCPESPYISIELQHQKAKGYIQFMPVDGNSIDINVKVNILAPNTTNLGFALFCIDCATKSERIRLMPGLYSGWNEDGKSLVVYPRYSRSLYRQFTLIKHYIVKEPKSILSSHQGVVFSYPEGMLGAVTELDFGTEVAGSWRMELGADDVWDPVLLEKADKLAPPDPGIQYPRYNYDQFLENWRVFMKHPELFVEVGKGMGFFHRGYHKVLKGNMLPCGAHPFKGFFRDTEAKSRKSRLCELSWGGSANCLLAYTLFLTGEDWAKEKASAIVKATVEFKDGGYQIKEGPIKGAWWNGYLVDEDRFCDRFASDNLYIPDSGITNYFFGKILLEKYSNDGRLLKMIENSCDYLKRIEFKDGGVPFGFKPDGRHALDRHSIEYKGDYAVPCAFAAISHLICYQLTGKEDRKKDAARLLAHLLKHVEKNNWRYHGYDTYGTNSQGLGWILAILSEFVMAGFKEAKDPSEKTFRALLSYQHTFDTGIDRHANHLTRPSGGKMKNRGTFPTGSSKDFMQDYNTGHNRFDPALGLWNYYRATCDPRGYVSLVNFLNNLTYHQWTNSTSIGFGATAERISFNDGDFNDQVQTLHSNPLNQLILNQNLFLLGAGVDIAKINTGSKELEFTLKSPVPADTWIMIGGNKGKPVCLTADGKKVYAGPASYIPCQVDKETTFKVSVF